MTHFGAIPYRINPNGLIQVIFVENWRHEWGFPKGKKEVGQRPLETVVEELMQETSQEINHLNHRLFFDLKYPSSKSFKVVRLYLATVREGVDPAPDLLDPNNDIIAAQWVTLEEAYELAGLGPQPNTETQKVLRKLAPLLWNIPNCLVR